MIKYILPVFVCMCALTFMLFFVDKQRAKFGENRVSEKALVTCSLLFGALGGILAMALFRHKTKKPKFYILLPIFLIVQIILLIKLF